MQEKLRILIVSDNRDWVSSLKSFLELASIEVTSGIHREGVYELIQSKPEVIITSYSSDFLRWVRQELSILGVVVVSFFETMSVELVCNKVEYISSSSDSISWNDRLHVANHEIINALTPLFLNFQNTAHKQNSSQLVIIAKRIKKLTRLFFDSGFLSTGRIQVNLQEEELNQIIKELIEQHQVVAIDRGVNLVFQSQEPIRRFFDRQLIEQIVTNLLSNAIKYGKGKPVRINTSLSDRSETVITVEDKGEGISKEAIGHIFEFRYRDHRTAKTYEGNGLGLWMTREIIKNLGGKISVKSDVGIGTRFSVYLPNRLAK